MNDEQLRQPASLPAEQDTDLNGSADAVGNHVEADMASVAPSDVNGPASEAAQAQAEVEEPVKPSVEPAGVVETEIPVAEISESAEPAEPVSASAESVAESVAESTQQSAIDIDIDTGDMTASATEIASVAPDLPLATDASGAP